MVGLIHIPYNDNDNDSFDETVAIRLRTLEGFDGTLLEGYRNYPSWVITPTSRELEELHNAYQSGNHELLVDLLGKVQGE